ncbi:MAG TPA: Calx-beta domain-containing protein [Solirubrobacteraceae bacterium]|nr:Calx-beta domain-containing protein [Solirubrobacteraceae bacterium]
MRHTRRALAALAVALATAFFTAEALAADSISFGEQGSTGTYGPNGVVRIDGSISFRDDCPKPGIDDFFYPATDVYIVDTGTGTGTLHDAGGGRPNTIVSGASLFTDEVIAIAPPAGTLDQGEYDVVYDNCQDGQYNPGFDTIFPGAVTVEMPDLIPVADDGIGKIKDEAREEYISWLATRYAMQGLFKLADKALKTECKTGSPTACASKQLFAASKIKERFLQLLLSESNHYLAIAEDPPDKNFDKPTVLEPVDVPRDHSDSAADNAVADSLQPIAGEAAVNAALLHAVERYQGAQAAGDAEWALVHAREARNLSETLRRIAPATGATLDTLEASVDSGIDGALATGGSFVHRVALSGFTGDERRALRNQGLTATQIANLETETRDLDREAGGMDGATVRAALDKVQAAHVATTAGLADSIAAWDQVVKTLEAKHNAPGLDAGGPYTATEGTALTLNGSATGDTGATAWDLDGDGGFDDATGLKPSVTFDRSGAYVIGLRAGDAVSYAVVQVADANRAPVLSSPLPATAGATTRVGNPLALSVSASDPDGDPITFAWTIDGADAGSGSSLTYSPAAAQVGGHTIEVTASAAGGTTRRAWDVIVLDKDADEDGWTKTTDCDETDPAVHPTADERLGNGVDDDCDTGTPDAPPGGLTGSMMSWGSNHNGTIGNGSSSPLLVASPVPIPGYDNVVQVEGGDRAGYALLDNGEVRVWGLNGTAQFGNGTLGGASTTPVSPLAAGGGSGRLTGVTQLSSDQHGFVAARRSDGTVVAWGENQAGEIGDGSTVTYRLYPAQVLTGPDAPLTGVRSLEGGYAENYAVMEDGTVRAWGQIRCDGGTSIRQERYAVPLPLAGSNIRQVASGDKMTLMLRKDGTVLECGHTTPVAGRPVTFDDMYVPKPVTGLGPGSGVIDIASGAENGLVLKSDGSVWTWGANNNWELGVLGYSGPASVPVPTQIPLPPGPPVVDVDMDNGCHALLRRADGSVLGYGCDFFEQVGNGPGPQSGVTTPTLISMPGRATFGISAAGWNSLALTRPVDDDWEAPATWVDASVADAGVAEAGGGRFAISLSAALPYDVTVDWSLAAGTAGADDVRLGDGTATIPAGATSVQVDAPVLDDALDEDAETFTVVLGDASHGIQLVRPQATVTISDDDAAPTVSVKPASVAEGDTTLTDAAVKVQLSRPSAKPVSVKYATADGTATSPADYAPASGTLAIAAGETEGVVHAAVRGDEAVELDEALSVSLSEPENATPGDASAALTITDDEPLALSVASPSVPEGDSGTTPATFTVALDAAPPAGTTVSADYLLVGVTANVPGDVTAASGTLTFAAGETVKQVAVQVKGDTDQEGDEAFRLVLSNLSATGGRKVLRGESSVATIVDDDTAEEPPPPPPPADTTPPQTTATTVPAPNAAGWHRQNVTVNLAATDAGSGVKEITYRLTGAQTAAAKTVTGAAATVAITTEGATTIAYQAKDNAGNVETERTLVVKLDKTAPTVTCSANPRTLWPADHRLVPVTVTVKVTDGRSGAGAFTLTSVTSNEADDAPGTGDGATTGDIRDFGLNTADVAGQLRAERANAGRGRNYTLTYVGLDVAGNQRTCTTVVNVPIGCTGAHARKAAREVRKARRAYAARLRGR